MTAIDKVIDEALNDDATGGLFPYESWEKLKGETAGAVRCLSRVPGLLAGKERQESR